MKAKIKSLIILIAIFSVSLVAGIFAGCIGEKNPKERADELGMTACVTYYTNGGNFVSGKNPPDEKAYRTDYYKPGTPIFNIGGGIEGDGSDEKTGQSLAVKRAGYVFAGWVYAKLDENNLPILFEVDSNGKKTGVTYPVLESGTASIIGSTGRELLEKNKRFWAEPTEEMVFANGHPTVGAGEHKYLVATWMPDILLEFKLITDAPIKTQIEISEEDFKENDNDYTKDKDGKYYKSVTYNNGDVISTQQFLLEDHITLYPDTAPATFYGFSYLHLYWDKECTEPVIAGTSIAKGKGDNPSIYAKYLSGRWKAVKTANDVSTMLSSDSSNYFFIFDVDCKDLTNLGYKTSGSYGAVIDGNGKTIKNMTVAPGNGIRGGNAGSLFGNLLASAHIKDLTIEDLSISLKLDASKDMYALFANVADGAKFENFAINNLVFSVEVSENGKINNIQNNTDSWIYGNKYSTDAEFVEHYGELVKNAKLIINDEELVSGGQL